MYITGNDLRYALNIINKYKKYVLCMLLQISVNNQTYLESTVIDLMKIWEETSYQLELRQANSEVVKMEWDNLVLRKEPEYKLTFDTDMEIKLMKIVSPIRVAVIREEGKIDTKFCL